MECLTSTDSVALSRDLGVKRFTLPRATTGVRFGQTLEKFRADQ